MLKKKNQKCYKQYCKFSSCTYIINKSGNPLIQTVVQT